MTIDRRIAHSEFTLTREYAVPVDRVWDAFADEKQKLSWWGAGDAIASLEFEPIDAGTRFTHAEYGLFFDQFWDGGASREAGTRGLLKALGNYLA